jgi:hypothetical protein
MNLLIHKKNEFDWINFEKFIIIIIIIIIIFIITIIIIIKLDGSELVESSIYHHIEAHLTKAQSNGISPINLE